MKEARLKKKMELASMSRRGFLRWSAGVGASAAAAGRLAGGLRKKRGASSAGAFPAVPAEPVVEKMVRTGCPSHNCGGRCLLRVYVRDGVIVRIDGDDRPADALDDPQLRACVRGRAYRRRQYHPDRLKFPLKRVGKRGEGKFERISWDEALDKIAAEFGADQERSTATRPSTSPTAPGATTRLNGRQTAERLMNLFGGSLGFYNSYSWAAISAATPTVYGTARHRQPAPGLAQCEVHPDVGLEPEPRCATARTASISSGRPARKGPASSASTRG